MLIEYPDAEERKRMLGLLRGIERGVWVQVAGHARMNAIADEDLDRETEEKTSSVHFLRFELDQGRRAALARGAAVTVGVEHPHYTASVELPADVRAALQGALEVRPDTALAEELRYDRLAGPLG